MRLVALCVFQFCSLHRTKRKNEKKPSGFFWKVLYMLLELYYAYAFAEIHYYMIIVWRWFSSTRSKNTVRQHCRHQTATIHSKSTIHSHKQQAIPEEEPNIKYIHTERKILNIYINKYVVATARYIGVRSEHDWLWVVRCSRWRWEREAIERVAVCERKVVAHICSLQVKQNQARPRMNERERTFVIFTTNTH